MFTLQMDAEAEDKTLRTRTKGAKGELASRFPSSAPTTPWHAGVRASAQALMCSHHDCSFLGAPIFRSSQDIGSWH